MHLLVWSAFYLAFYLLSHGRQPVCQLKAQADSLKNGAYADEPNILTAVASRTPENEC